MKITPGTKEVDVVVTKKETIKTVTIELEGEEILILKELTGSVSGRGKVRDFTNSLYNQLDKIEPKTVYMVHFDGAVKTK